MTSSRRHDGRLAALGIDRRARDPLLGVTLTLSSMLCRSAPSRYPPGAYSPTTVVGRSLPGANRRFGVDPLDGA